MTSECEQYGALIASNYVEIVEITLGNKIIHESIPIICPNQITNDTSHRIVRNGHDSGNSKNSQQYLCKTCNKSFYGHTSREIVSLTSQLRSILSDRLKDGRLNTGIIAASLNISQTSASRILHKILQLIPESPKFKDVRLKQRNSNSLFVDETFLKIGGKTWYLIVVLSGNQKIMDFRLVEHRNLEVLLDMIRDCASRLNYTLKLLITDGFQVYKGVAYALRRDLTHIRHIHKPPYGRIEFDIYSVAEHNVKILHVESSTDISAYSGYFLATSKSSVKNYGTKKKGRRAGGINRSKEIIEKEKAEKLKNKRKRGRPKGIKVKEKAMELHVFEHNKKDGWVRAVCDSSKPIANALNTVFRQFAEKSITTNLVENIFSVLKKLINFRGQRNVDGWQKLLIGYFALRDNPKLLDHVLKSVKLNPLLVLAYNQGISMKYLEVDQLMSC